MDATLCRETKEFFLMANGYLNDDVGLEEEVDGWLDSCVLMVQAVVNEEDVDGKK